MDEHGSAYARSQQKHIYSECCHILSKDVLVRDGRSCALIAEAVTSVGPRCRLDRVEVDAMLLDHNRKDKLTALCDFDCSLARHVKEEDARVDEDMLVLVVVGGRIVNDSDKTCSEHLPSWSDVRACDLNVTLAVPYDHN